MRWKDFKNHHRYIQLKACMSFLWFSRAIKVWHFWPLDQIPLIRASSPALTQNGLPGDIQADRALSLPAPTPSHMDHTHARTHTRTKPARRSQLSCIGFASALGVDRACKDYLLTARCERTRQKRVTFLSNLRVNWRHEPSQMILGDTFVTFSPHKTCPTQQAVAESELMS